MFKLIQSGPTCGDCTAPYNVILDKEYTVEDFIKTILLRSNEWGYIGIFDGKSIFGNPNCEYRYGNLKTHLPNGYLSNKVVRVMASGGWTRMDYILTVEEQENESK